MKIYRIKNSSLFNDDDFTYSYGFTKLYNNYTRWNYDKMLKDKSLNIKGINDLPAFGKIKQNLIIAKYCKEIRLFVSQQDLWNLLQG